MTNAETLAARLRNVYAPVIATRADVLAAEALRWVEERLPSAHELGHFLTGLLHRQDFPDAAPFDLVADKLLALIRERLKGETK